METVSRTMPSYAAAHMDSAVSGTVDLIVPEFIGGGIAIPASAGIGERRMPTAASTRCPHIAGSRHVVGQAGSKFVGQAACARESWIATQANNADEVPEAGGGKRTRPEGGVRSPPVPPLPLF